MKKGLLRVFFIVSLFILILGNGFVSADTGIKPSINIKINNIEKDDYIIDLFVYDNNTDGKKDSDYFQEYADLRRDYSKTSERFI